MDIKHQLCHDKYNDNPKFCLRCLSMIPYECRNNNFCSYSCAAISRNLSRGPHKEETKEKISRKQKNQIHQKRVSKITWCEICSSLIKGKRKTCSIKCLRLKQSQIGMKSAAKRIIRSKDEIELFELCKNHFKSVRHNEPIVDKWDADIIIDDLKLAILWNGPWHYKQMPHKNHSLKQVQTRDGIKIQKLSAAGWTTKIFEDRAYTPQSAFNELVGPGGFEPPIIPAYETGAVATEPRTN